MKTQLLPVPRNHHCSGPERVQHRLDPKLDRYQLKPTSSGLNSLHPGPTEVKGQEKDISADHTHAGHEVFKV